MRDKICLALDVDLGTALNLLSTMKGVIKTVKIGPVLFLQGGLTLVQHAVNSGYDVFLDLKHKDIPSVVAEAGRRYVHMGVKYFTVHADGGYKMLHDTWYAVEEEATRFAKEPPRILAVTVLTSMDKEELVLQDIHTEVRARIVKLADIAVAAGIRNFVCSPHEVKLLKSTFEEAFCVTPGIKVRQNKEDQERVSSPKVAMMNGSDLMVIGRDIYRAPDPVKAVEEINVCL